MTNQQLFIISLKPEDIGREIPHRAYCPYDEGLPTVMSKKSAMGQSHIRPDRSDVEANRVTTSYRQSWEVTGGPGSRTSNLLGIRCLVCLTIAGRLYGTPMV